MISPDVQILELKRQAQRANEAASLELPLALQRKERDALAMLAEVEAAKAQIASDKRNARSSRIRDCKQNLVNLRATYEPEIEAAVRSGDPQALATAIHNAAAAVNAASPEIDAVREIMTDVELNGFVQACQHVGVTHGSVRAVVAVVKGALNLSADGAAAYAPRVPDAIVLCIKSLGAEESAEMAAVLIEMLIQLRRISSCTSAHHGYQFGSSGRSDNLARFSRGLDLFLLQGGYEGPYAVDVLTLLRHESLGLDC